MYIFAFVLKFRAHTCEVLKPLFVVFSWLQWFASTYHTCIRLGAWGSALSLKHHISLRQWPADDCANETTAVFSPTPKDFLIVPLQRGAADTRAVKRVSVRDFVRSISCSGVAGALDPTLPSRWAAHCWWKLICTVPATAYLHSTELWPLLMAVIEYLAAGRRSCYRRHPQYRATAIVNAVNTILC